MIVRLMVYRTESVEKCQDWFWERAGQEWERAEVNDLRIVTYSEPPRIGAAVYFTSGEAYEEYCHEHLRDFKEDVQERPWYRGPSHEQVVEWDGTPLVCPDGTRL